MRIRYCGAITLLAVVACTLGWNVPASEAGGPVVRTPATGLAKMRFATTSRTLGDDLPHQPMQLIPTHWNSQARLLPPANDLPAILVTYMQPADPPRSNAKSQITESEDSFQEAWDGIPTPWYAPHPRQSAASKFAQQQLEFGGDHPLWSNNTVHVWGDLNSVTLGWVPPLIGGKN